MSPTWGLTEQRELEEVAIIFFESWIADHPWRSCETIWNQTKVSREEAQTTTYYGGVRADDAQRKAKVSSRALAQVIECRDVTADLKVIKVRPEVSFTLLYACGHPEMIADIQARFTPKGFRVKEERYWKA